jgi:hypothetical protein
MQRLAISADSLATELPFLRTGPTVDHSAIGQRKHDVKSVVVFLVGDTSSRQPPIKALHGFRLLALLVAFGVWLAPFAAAIATAARVTDIIANEAAAAHAVRAISHVVFVEAHLATAITGRLRGSPFSLNRLY